MTDMIVFEFNFQGISYKAIATPWKNGGNGCFRITVMNGEIENLLFGHNVLSLSENRFLNNENVNNPELAELQRCILQQFPKHLTPVEKLAS